MGSCALSISGIDMLMVQAGSVLGCNDYNTMIRPFTTIDLELALKGIHVDKSPGIDGLNSFFFRKSWDIMKGHILEAYIKFFRDRKMYPMVNRTTITLIPKIPNACEVKQFRPISCCNMLYKLISKMLAVRLQQVIPKVVSLEQAGFIPGRQILDNVLLATKLIKGYGQKSVSPRCMIKIDLKKACDSIEWPFVEEMVHALGFPNMFVTWIMNCITTISYFIFINGKPSKPFRVRKGLRQGDPLSYFLFAIAMEYLSRCLGSLTQNPQFHFHPRCKRVSLTHIMFADDLLLFCRAEIQSVRAMMTQFEKFSRSSGLSANQDKSEVYFAGVNQDIQDTIYNELQMRPGSLPF